MYQLFMQKQAHQKQMLKMKNSLVSSTAQYSDVHRQKNSEIQKAIQNNEQNHIANHQEVSDKFQEFTVKISRPETSSSLHKRMKLKDYLHLKDLQKKSTAHNETHLIDSSESQHLQKQSSSISCKQHSKLGKEKETSAKPLQSHDHKEQDNVDLIKDEVDAKIEQQIKKLSDLQKYLKSDFVPKDKKTETFIFLFTMYNKLIDMHKINEEIGDMIIDYGNQQENKHTYLQPKSSGYHWDSEKRNLVDPAKQSNQRLQRIRNSHHQAEKK